MRGRDRVVRFSTKTDSLAEVEMDGEVVENLEAEARSISAAEQGTTNSASKEAVETHQRVWNAPSVKPGESLGDAAAGVLLSLIHI